MVGISIGSANQEWRGEQLPGMEGEAPHSGLPGCWQQICVSPEESGGQPQSIRVGIHLASLKRGVKVAVSAGS